MLSRMARTALLTDEVRGRIEAVLLPEKGVMVRPSTPHPLAVGRVIQRDGMGLVAGRLRS